MTTLAHADIFFFISSIGFVVLFILLAVVLVHVIRLIRSLQRTLEALKAKAKGLEEEAEVLIDEVRDSMLFRLLFGRKRSAQARRKKS